MGKSTKGSQKEETRKPVFDGKRGVTGNGNVLGLRDLVGLEEA